MSARGCQSGAYRKALRNLYLGRPLPRLSGTLDEHLKTCASCRTLAETLAMADRTLGAACGADAALSPLEEELAWHTLAESLSIPPRRPAQSPARWMVPAGFAAAVLLVVAWLFTLGPLRSGGEPGFSVRGDEAPPAIETVCIAGDDRARSARTGSAKDACRIDETLGFAYLNPGGRYRGLALFAVDAGGEVLWYLPNPAEPEGFEISRADRAQAIDRTVRLAVNHRPGTYTLIALFTPEPLSFSRVEGLAKKLALGQDKPSESHMVRRDLRVKDEAP